MKIPFKAVVGGQSFLTSESVRDVMAYLSLSLSGSQNRIDDDAFDRVLNKPPRPKMKQMIQARSPIVDGDVIPHTEERQDLDTTVGLEEAAKSLLDATILSKSQRKDLASFFNLFHELRVAAISMPLPYLIRYVWKKTGLADFHTKKRKFEEESVGDCEDSDEEVAHEGDDGGSPVNAIKPDKLTRHLQTPVAVAEGHVKIWKAYDNDTEQLAPGTGNRLKTLGDLAKACCIAHAAEIPPDRLPQLWLPESLQDELYMP